MAIATAVSKYLRDANPETVKWSMLLDHSKLIKYCKSLKDLMTGSGIVQKLESIDDGLRYMKAEGKGDSHDISNIRESMKVWRQSYRKEKVAADISPRLERRSDEGHLSLDDVSGSVRCIII